MMKKFLILLSCLVLLSCGKKKDLNEPTTYHLHPLDHAEKVQAAEHLINVVLNSERFKANVYAASFTETDGDSSRDVYYKYREDDLKIDVYFYYEDSDTIAKAKDGKDEIYYNIKYLDFPDEMFAAVLMHEIGHILGYRHDNPSQMLSSVPYQIENIFLRSLP